MELVRIDNDGNQVGDVETMAVITPPPHNFIDQAKAWIATARKTAEDENVNIVCGDALDGDVTEKVINIVAAPFGIIIQNIYQPS
jgi:hypothetical protein